jgi:hypothetical protein
MWPVGRVQEAWGGECEESEMKEDYTPAVFRSYDTIGHKPGRRRSRTATGREAVRSGCLEPAAGISAMVNGRARGIGRCVMCMRRELVVVVVV